jgi:hypothetical protein
MRRADSLWPAIVAWPGNDRLATQDKEQMDITPLFRSDRCTVVLPKSFEIPWEFEQWSRTGKKFAGWDPFRGEKPGETPILGVQNQPKMHPFGVKTMANGSPNLRVSLRRSRSWALRVTGLAP